LICMVDIMDSTGDRSEPRSSQNGVSHGAEAKPEARLPSHKGKTARTWLRGSKCKAAGEEGSDARHSRLSAAGGNATSSSSSPPQDLEQKFEDEFTRHLKKSNRTAKWALTGIGAGIGGALALAAAPLAIPAMVAATVVGGGAGHQLAKHQGEKRLQMNKRNSSEAASQRPALRRLRFLVKWGYWQLLEYENEAAEWRGAVVGEVVRAFSPWVQAMFLLRARAATGVEEGDAEAQEIFQHLAPLYHWLQRRTTYQAVVDVAHAVHTAFDRGTVHAGHAELFTELGRVAFPTILETISIMDRLSPATQAKLFEDKASHFATDSQAPDRREFLKTQRRKRLRATVDSIQQVLARVEVQEVLAGRRKLRDAVEVEQEAEEVDENLAPFDSPRELASKRSVELVVPPLGVEEEADGDSPNASENGSDADFQSCAGDASDADVEGLTGLTRPATRRSLSRGVSGAGMPDKQGAGGPRPLKFRGRLAAFPRGGGDHAWDASDPSQFHVRSATYLKDRKKAPSGPCMLELVNVEFTLISPDGPVWSKATHRDFYPMQHRLSGDQRFLFILNWILPPYEATIIAALDPNAPWLLDDTSPQARAWHRFLAMSPEEQKNSLKVIVSVENGPWLVTRAVPKKPILAGKQLQTYTRYEPGEFFEVAFDVASAGKSDQVVKLVMGCLWRLRLGFAVLIEGKQEDELPETLLICAAFSGIDTKRLYCPDESLE